MHASTPLLPSPPPYSHVNPTITPSQLAMVTVSVVAMPHLGNSVLRGLQRILGGGQGSAGDRAVGRAVVGEEAVRNSHGADRGPAKRVSRFQRTNGYASNGIASARLRSNKTRGRGRIGAHAALHQRTAPAALPVHVSPVQS